MWLSIAELELRKESAVGTRRIIGEGGPKKQRRQSSLSRDRAIVNAQGTDETQSKGSSYPQV